MQGFVEGFGRHVNYGKPVRHRMWNYRVFRIVLPFRPKTMSCEARRWFKIGDGCPLGCVFCSC